MSLMLHLNRDRHYLPREATEASRFIQRHFPKVPLFVYLHLHTGNWVVAQWASKGRGLAMELVTLGPVPWVTREKAEQIRDCLRPKSRGDLMRNLAAFDKARQLRDEEDDAIRDDLLSKLVRDAHPGAGARPFLFVPAPKKLVT